MTWDLDQAIKNRTVAEIAVDPQNHYGEIYLYFRELQDFKRNSHDLWQFHHDLKNYSSIPSVTVMHDTNYTPAKESHVASINSWYDPQNLHANRCHSSYQYLSNKTTGLVYPFDHAQHLCIKPHGSCFKDTGMASFLEKREISHILFTGLYLDRCVTLSLQDAVKQGFSVGLIEDLTCATPQFKRDIEKHGYRQTMHAFLNNDDVLITNKDTVITSLARHYRQAA